MFQYLFPRTFEQSKGKGDGKMHFYSNNLIASSLYRAHWQVWYTNFLGFAEVAIENSTEKQALSLKTSLFHYRMILSKTKYSVLIVKKIHRSAR